jgi:hypothetical protein
LLASFGIVSAQIIEIAPNSLVVDRYSGLSYEGGGEFRENRSCIGTVMFTVEFTHIEFDLSTRMLTIEGSVLDRTRNGEARTEKIRALALLGGPITKDTVRSLYDGKAMYWYEYHMDVRQQYAADDPERFKLSVGPLRAEDRIAFVPRPIEPTETEREGYYISWCPVFEVGLLVTSDNATGDGPSLGQR